ncbi:hypothetical protein [Rubrivirga sp.]|uniref:hypothetical protein n=1 Tax=Rubrivirga sp. TaxID=1885344 RepID=UPI003B51C1D2
MRAFILSLALAVPFALTGCQSEGTDAVEEQGDVIEEDFDATTDAIEDVDPTPFEGDTATVVDDDVMDDPLVDADPDTTGL